MDKARSGKEKKDPKEMHFIDHLEEFRWVLIRCALAFLTGCILVGTYLGMSADFLAAPLEIATARLGVNIGSLVTISPLGAFTVMLQVIFLGGLALSLPFVLYFFAHFLAPGLTPKEQKVLFPGCVLGMLLFLLGASFAYYFILPLSIYVSLQFNQMLGLQIVWSAVEYYNFVVWMVLAVGGSFQFPLILLLLQYVEIVSPEMLRKVRPTVAVVILVVSALITPADPISMLILAVPLMLLYEASILIGAAVLRRKWDAEAKEETDLLAP
jgi:sec-independent protein translocase protein TatC